MRQWREEHVRRSEEAVELWEYVLSRYPRSLGDELWLIYEQVIVAYLFLFISSKPINANVIFRVFLSYLCNYFSFVGWRSFFRLAISI